MSLESLITIAVTAVVTGASNAFGIWIISKHVISRMEKKQGENAKNNRA